MKDAPRGEYTANKRTRRKPYDTDGSGKARDFDDTDETCRAAYLGEVFGTGILGALLAYPVAVLLMGREAALFAYVIPFLVSTAGGTLMAAVLLAGLLRCGVFCRLKEMN